MFIYSNKHYQIKLVSNLHNVPEQKSEHWIKPGSIPVDKELMVLQFIH